LRSAITFNPLELSQVKAAQDTVQHSSLLLPAWWFFSGSMTQLPTQRCFEHKGVQHSSGVDPKAFFLLVGTAELALQATDEHKRSQHSMFELATLS